MGQGATMALPIWALYMKKNYADEDLKISKADFEKPENLSIRIDCDKPDNDAGTQDTFPDELDF